MFSSEKRGRIVVLSAAIVLGLAVSGCSGLTSTRTQGYALSDSALQQIRAGQSKDLVRAVLGTPQSESTLGEDSAYYYVQTTVEETAFGLRNVKERKVLAVYFDKNDRVKERALYGLEDGRVINLETRRTPSYGEDRTFIESIISSLTGG